MKRLLAVACLLALAAHAQTSAVPNTISYQGRVTDPAGNPLGSPTAISRQAVFRVYDNATGGTRLWSEKQTITIFNGDFSVLLGTGTQYLAETNPNSLQDIFTSSLRFLSVTIADAGGALNSEITPRQQLVTTAFAFRAKVAESVSSLAVSSSMIANNAITTTQLADTAVTAGKLAADIGVWTAGSGNIYRASGNTGFGLTTPQSPVHVHGSGEVRMQVTDTTSGTALTDGLMLSLGASEAALWVYENRALKFGTNNSERFRIAANGNVGIGITNPFAKLSLGGDGGNTKLALWDNGAGSALGLGVGDAQFRLHLNASSERFSFLNSAAGTEVMTVAGAGRVGINNASPVGTLNITATGDSRLYLQTPTTGAGASDGLAIGVHNNAGFVWMYENLPLQFATNDTQRMYIDAVGRIGMNQQASGVARVSIKMATNDVYGLTIRNPADTADAFAFALSGEAYKSGGGSWGNGSDRRLKKNIEPLAGSLDQLLRLRSVTYDYQDPEKWGRGRFTGFIAQEVEPLFPDWVSENPDGMKMLAPKGFESLAVQAFRELRAEKDEQNATLVARVKTLEAQNAALAAQVDTLNEREVAGVSRMNALELRLNALARTLAPGASQ